MIAFRDQTDCMKTGRLAVDTMCCEVHGTGFITVVACPQAVAARDFYVKNLLSPKHFLSHTLFDVGSL